MKRFLKVGGFFVALMMVAAMGYAQTLTVGSGSGGQTLTIPVTFTNDANNVVGLQFDVNFNTTLVNITGATAGSALSGTSFGFNTSSPSAGVRRIVISPPIVTPLPNIPDGEIAVLTINIIGASGTAPLALADVSMSDTDGGSVTPAALNDGTITINETTYTVIVVGGPADGATLSSDKGTFAATPTSIPAPAGAPANFIYGLLDFTILGLNPDDTVTVEVTMPGNVPAQSIYYKYQGGQFSQYNNVTGLNDGDQTFIITLEF